MISTDMKLLKKNSKEKLEIPNTYCNSLVYKSLIFHSKTMIECGQRLIHSWTRNSLMLAQK